jgi:hypothetical protein
MPPKTEWPAAPRRIREVLRIIIIREPRRRACRSLRERCDRRSEVRDAWHGSNRSLCTSVSLVKQP